MREPLRPSLLGEKRIQAELAQIVGRKPLQGIGLRSIVLLLLLFGWGFLAALPSAACLPVRPSSREHFHDATAIYEATAVGGEGLFRVTKVWEGPNVETLDLVAEVRELYGIDSCVWFPPPVSGHSYVLVLHCGEKCDVVFESTADNPDRIGWLQGGRLVRSQDLEKRLEAWRQGKLRTADFAGWLKETEPIAVVTDWAEDETGFEGSPVGSVLQFLARRLEEPGQICAKAERRIKNRAVPAGLRFLRGRPDEERLELFEEQWEAALEFCDAAPGS